MKEGTQGWKGREGKEFIQNYEEKEEEMNE
jgi:hypothetical protein